MEEVDDFGDLYSGLDGDAIVGIVSIPESEPKEFDSIIEEDCTDVPIGEADGKETGDAVAESCDSSDSEDDLHIVLNDEDGGDFPPLQRLALGNGRLGAGWGNEEGEGDDMVLVSDANGTGKDQFTQPADGFTQGGAERGCVMKCGFRNWHVASHLGGFPSNTIPSTSGRADQDHLMMPCSEGTLPFKSGVSISTNFCLPRNRTIFDIDIDDFPQKPWKNHGVDVTDFFNFGLDEESWKNYCRSMGQYRQHSTHIRFPFNESPRMNQIFEAETVSTKAWSSEFARSGRGERFSIHENVDKGVGFNLPRGRAIQVEGGFGERIPSTDMRRSRQRDSDAVIHIATDDCIKDASLPWEDELKHVEQRYIDGSILESEDEFHKRSYLNHDVQRFEETTSPVEHHYRGKRAISRASTVKDKAKVNCKKDDVVDPPRSTDSASCDQLLHSSSPSGLESRSVASKDGSSLEKVLSSGKRTSVSSVSGVHESFKSDYCHSNDSRSDTTKGEHGHNEDSLPDCSPYMGEHKRSSRTRTQAKTDLTDNENISSETQKKHRKVSSSMELSYRQKTRKCDDGSDSRWRLSYYEETEVMSHGYKRRRDAEKYDGGKQFVRSSHKKDNHDASLCGNQDEEFCGYRQRSDTRGNGMMRRDFNFHESYGDDHVTRAIARERCDKPISGHKSPLRRKDSCLRQKKERKNIECLIRVEGSYHDIVLEERYREEYPHDMHGRTIPYCDKKEKNFDHKFTRHVPRTARERKCTYDSNSCFDLNRSSKYIEAVAKTRRCPDRRLLDSQAYRESPDAGDRGWLNANSPTNHLPVSWWSKERIVDHRNHNTREIRYMNKENECYIAPTSKDHYHSYENALSFGNDDRSAEEMDPYTEIVYNENRRFNRSAKSGLHPNELECSHEEWDGMLSPERSLLRDRSSRHERSRVSHHFGSGRKFYDGHSLNISAKKTRTEGNSDSDSRENNNFVSDLFDKEMSELAALSRREAANMHVNGLKGKFPRRLNELTCQSGGHRYPDNTRITEHIEQVNKRKRVRPFVLEVEERSRVPPSSTMVEKARESKTGQSEYLKTMLQDNEDDEIEEGQLIEESDSQDVVPETKEDKSMQPKDKTVGGYDSTRFLETLAKMEKRRERFKEPIAQKSVSSEKVQNPEPEVAPEPVQLQRPARKRLWAGS